MKLGIRNQSHTSTNPFQPSTHFLIPSTKASRPDQMSMLRSSVLRATPLATPTASSSSVIARHVPAAVQSRKNSSYAVSNVELVDIEERWEHMGPSQQAELWMQLRDRMKGSWAELTAQEKRACTFLASPTPRDIPASTDAVPRMQPTISLLDLTAPVLAFRLVRALKSSNTP
jgi:cytochrome c oxidase subunit 4